jgi:hypothetical protein
MAGVTITVRKNGPYLVSGAVELRDADGNPLPRQGDGGGHVNLALSGTNFSNSSFVAAPCSAIFQPHSRPRQSLNCGPWQTAGRS